MVDFLLVLIGVLLAATVGAAVEYYRQIRRVHREYDKAKEVVEDVILSFNRQLRREGEKLETLAFKVEALSSKSERALSKAEEVEGKVHLLEEKVGPIAKVGTEVLTKVDDVDKKVRDMIASHENLVAKVSTIEEQLRQFSETPEIKAEAVIPIKKEKALAPLTETEVAVLKMLALEGPKTAPEIKERVKLSREHTARLMKKLYEDGYLERDTKKIPFKYSVKKEMEDILKKAESEAA
ncbi:MAG: helix-turn-helix domain-containing protein [Candidatus Bathyarchaeales archaeon]